MRFFYLRCADNWLLDESLASAVSEIQISHFCRKCYEICYEPRTSFTANLKVNDLLLEEKYVHTVITVVLNPKSVT